MNRQRKRESTIRVLVVIEHQGKTTLDGSDESGDTVFKVCMQKVSHWTCSIPMCLKELMGCPAYLRWDTIGLCSSPGLTWRWCLLVQLFQSFGCFPYLHKLARTANRVDNMSVTACPWITFPLLQCADFALRLSSVWVGRTHYFKFFYVQSKLEKRNLQGPFSSYFQDYNNNVNTNELIAYIFSALVHSVASPVTFPQ